MRSLGTTGLGAALVVMAGCSESSTLVVQVRTDLTPGVELGGVGLDLEEDPDDGAWDHFVAADATADWRRGVRIAEITGLPSGPRSFRVGAEAPDGTRLVERGVRIELSAGVRVVTVLLTRDCAGVVCPGDGDDPGHSACLGGRCTDPRCSLESPEHCPAPECNADAQCTPAAGGGECGVAVCFGGTCATFLEDARCSAPDECRPEGCVPPDATPLDAGQLDAGLIADAGADDAAGPDVGADAGPADAGPADAGAPDAGAPTDVVELTAGDWHTCARLRSGAGRCWGTNGYGQLGDDTMRMDRLTPVPVVDLEGAVEIAAGYYHSCARSGSGAVQCWGRNDSGQLGNGMTRRELRPASVVDLTDAVQLAGGAHFTCARLSSGQLRCWGSNMHGQLGNGARRRALRPVPVMDLTGAVELTVGAYHACARLGSGGVRCWGRNEMGQLGDGTIDLQTTPVPVTGLTDAVELVAGRYHTCARLSSGAVRCWGYNVDGQLGDGTSDSDPHPSPVAVTDLSDAVELSACNWHTCARLRSGAVRCWGYNDVGQLGIGTSDMDPHPRPVAVTDLSDAVELSAGGWHTCARLSSGAVRCWGYNAYGQLGDGTSGEDRLSPVTVMGL